MNTYNFKKAPFSGAATAIATPFENGSVDIVSLRRLCRWQLDMGIDAICVAGTTGEAATLTREERRSIFDNVKAVVGDKIPVIAGCGSSDTATACVLCREAAERGADALLVITPYCNKGTAKGLVEHYKRVSFAAGETPVILYNVPSRTGVDISFEQYLELSREKNIVAVKEATANLTKITRLSGETPLNVYSGNDDMILPVAAVGGKGVISVLSNLLPAETAAMTRAALDGESLAARAAAHRYAHLIELLFKETNPAPLKYALSLLDLCSGEMRLPMGEIGDGLKSEIKNEMQKLEMI